MRISADAKIEEIGRRVDGGFEEHKTTGTFVAEVLVLVEGLRAGGNRICGAKPAWMVL